MSERFIVKSTASYFDCSHVHRHCKKKKEKKKNRIKNIIKQRQTQTNAITLVLETLRARARIRCKRHDSQIPTIKYWRLPLIVVNTKIIHIKKSKWTFQEKFAIRVGATMYLFRVTKRSFVVTISFICIWRVLFWISNQLNQLICSVDWMRYTFWKITSFVNGWIRNSHVIRFIDDDRIISWFCDRYGERKRYIYIYLSNVVWYHWLSCDLSVFFYDCVVSGQVCIHPSEKLEQLQ